MRSVKHPNIVGCFGSECFGGYFNILIEWMQGLYNVHSGYYSSIRLPSLT